MNKTSDTPKGPPKGNKNAVKHGFFTQKEIKKRKALHGLIRDLKTLTKKIGD
ncbi:hypothetical protein [Desulfonatronovibrio magnus]|uniref:hypothetical protein n=1 Tax=Desulfonatronovibrio magnus TaxID=698827 RepID=UPI0012FB572B|nr:hypothetical protein [Desulfonatronovibrio magnus]